MDIENMIYSGDILAYDVRFKNPQRNKTIIYVSMYLGCFNEIVIDKLVHFFVSDKLFRYTTYVYDLQTNQSKYYIWQCRGDISDNERSKNLFRSYIDQVFKNNLKECET